MTQRRLSQAISEGDGISVVVIVDGPEAARSAAASGADAVLILPEATPRVDAIRAATELPVVAAVGERDQPPDAADACVVSLREGDRDRLEHARALGSDTCELAVRIETEDDLEFVLDELDPEIIVLAGGSRDRAERLAGVLELLPDVPAGKLAIADFPASSRSEVEELERAGVDAVIVAAANVEHLVGVAPPEV